MAKNFPEFMKTYKSTKQEAKCIFIKEEWMETLYQRQICNGPASLEPM